MSMLARLGATFGVGSVRVGITAAEPQSHRGSAVTAAVRIEGGTVAQDVQMLTVDLVEYWVTGSGKNRTHHRHVRERVVAAEALTVEPHFAQEFPVILHLPADARCTPRREGWCLSAEAHIRWAVDARAEVPLNVLPHREVLAIQRAVKGPMGFRPCAWDGAHDVIVYDFAAPDDLRHVLDGMTLRLRVTGDALEGEAVLQEANVSIALVSAWERLADSADDPHAAAAALQQAADAANEPARKAKLLLRLGAILAGDRVTGNSVIRLAQRMDAGAVLGQSRLEIGEMETCGELHDRLAEDGARLLTRVVADLAAGRAQEQEQDESQATLAGKVGRESARLDFTADAESVARRIRAMYPWPGCGVRLVAGGAEAGRLTLVRARPISAQPASAGAIEAAGTIDAAGRIVAGLGAVEVVDVQPEGGRVMSLRAYRNGRPWPVGAKVESL